MIPKTTRLYERWKVTKQVLEMLMINGVNKIIGINLLIHEIIDSC